MSKWRKKPVIIDAFKWTGDKEQTEDPSWIVEAIKERRVSFSYNETLPGCQMKIATLEGDIFATQGDYIIKDVKDELYPCKPAIFELTYEAVEELAE